MGKNYLHRGSVLKIYEPHLKILTPYGFLNAYFLFIDFFYVNSGQFFMDISVFSWEVSPPDPPPFIRCMGQKFFSWGVR